MADSAYFDSCIFIELIQQTRKKRFDACEALRKKAERKELVIVTSTLSITEVNKLSDLPILPEEQSKRIIEFFKNFYIKIRVADRPIAEYAHELTRTHKLSNIDAIHVATAILGRVPVLYTYDGMKRGRKLQGLLKHDGMIGKPGRTPLRIETPPDPDAGTLFDEKNKVTEGDEEPTTKS